MKWRPFLKWRPLLVGGVTVAAVFLLLRGADRLRLHAPDGPAGKPIRVEVLNGSGVYRAGQGLADRLRDFGFDVVDVRNADRYDYEETLVLDRIGVPDYAEAVCRKLGVSAPVEQRNGDLLLEVTVILGADLAETYRGGGLP